MIFEKEKEEVEKYKKQRMKIGRGENKRYKENVVFRIHNAEKQRCEESDNAK